MPTGLRKFAVALALAALVAGCASPSLQPAAPESVGLSGAKLKEMSAAYQAKVDGGDIPGAVLMVVRNGKVAWHDAVGFQDREAGKPMRPDALFRIASMTKPVTSVAVLMLQEQGRLQLSDPVSRHLPEFARLQVGLERAGADLAMQPAAREMTVLDLLRHTSGLTYGFLPRTPVREQYVKTDLMNPGHSPQEFKLRLAKLPLRHEPGTAWEYGVGHDLAARVVEAAAGQPFDQFLQERIFKPLGMHDTGFTLRPDQAGRLAEPQVLAATGRRPAWPAATERPNWIPGGHGLVSTAADFARFCQMLLDGGTLDGVRILSEASVAALRSNQLTPAIAINPAWNNMGITAPTAENGQGFGLGVAVRVAEGQNRIPGSIGDFSWLGINGTYFFADPRERLFAILMLQAPPPTSGPYRLLLRQHVYGALQRLP